MSLHLQSPHQLVLCVLWVWGTQGRAQMEQMEGEWMLEIKMWSQTIRSCGERLKCFKGRNQGATERARM